MSRRSAIMLSAGVVIGALLSAALYWAHVGLAWRLALTVLLALAALACFAGSRTVPRRRR